MFAFLGTVVKSGTYLIMFSGLSVGLITHTTKPSDESFIQYLAAERPITGLNTGINCIDTISIKKFYKPKIRDFFFCKTAKIETSKNGIEKKEEIFLGVMNNWVPLE
jgi:hypothetical protein